MKINKKMKRFFAVLTPIFLTTNLFGQNIEFTKNKLKNK
jgi:hypothetical protein